MAEVIQITGQIKGLTRSNLPWNPDTLNVVDENGNNFDIECQAESSIEDDHLVLGSSNLKDSYDLKKMLDIRAVKVTRGSKTSILLRAINEL